MRWTKKRYTKKTVGIFQNKFTPIAKKLKKDGITPFTTKFDADTESYFIDRDRFQMTRKDFKCLGSGSDREILECLKAKWIEEGLDELTPLISEFESLVENLPKETHEKKDVDSFVYTMH